MPNVLAHAHITSETSKLKTSNVVLGSTLPDFMGMYADRFHRLPAIHGHNVELDFGINYHYETDKVFDSQPEKPKTTSRFSEHLISAGIKPGAARLTAVLLSDVIIDGALLGREDAVNNFEWLAQKVHSGTKVPETRTVNVYFNKFVRGYFEAGVPLRYTDPHSLANIAHNRLDSRAITSKDRDRFTFKEDQIPDVAEITDIHYERISRLGLAALDRTISIMAA